MTAASVTCPNGHHNPEHQRFCGECGAVLPVICPNGHQCPPHQRFCGECGAAVQESAPEQQPPEVSSSEDGIGSVGQAPLASRPQHHKDDAQNASDGDGASGPLKVGDRVQVTSAGDRYDQWKGTVYRITEKATYGFDIRVDFGSVKAIFRLDQLTLVGDAAPQQRASQQFVRESKADVLPKANSFQQGSTRAQDNSMSVQGGSEKTPASAGQKPAPRWLVFFAWRSHADRRGLS
jgi:hypothetical protein